MDGLETGTETGVTPGGDAADVSGWGALKAVTKRSAPRLAEATLIPSAIFSVTLGIAGLAVALLSCLGWTYFAMFRRVSRGEPAPPLVVLSAVGITIRTVAALLSGSAFVYFLQPVITAWAMGALFFGSAFTARPMVAKLAGEFFPLTEEAAARPSVARLFRRLTFLWAVAHALSGALTLALLMRLSLGPFVAVKTIASLGLTGVTISITIAASLRVARREGLLSVAALALGAPAGDAPVVEFPLDPEPAPLLIAA